MSRSLVQIGATHSKGAGALLARLTTARHSKDIDMFFNATDADVDDAVDALKAALRIDLGDHFAFDITRVAPLQEEAKGARVHVNTRLGPTSFATFHIDVVVGTVSAFCAVRGSALGTCFASSAKPAWDSNADRRTRTSAGSVLDAFASRVADTLPSLMASRRRCQASGSGTSMTRLQPSSASSSATSSAVSAAVRRSGRACRDTKMTGSDDVGGRSGMAICALRGT